jgi:hypothetical protein
VDRSIGAKQFSSEPLPDAPWPVEARNLLTDRELSLYQSLLSLYPEHKVFVQVALSQLIEVVRNHPERRSIRARYQQLVADFVLCRADLSVVAVIEFDDSSHDNPRNEFADARKSKALKDARIKLVRISSDALPSEDRISKLIDAGGAARRVSRHQTVLRLAETVDTYEDSVLNPDQPSDASMELRVRRTLALKIVLCGVLAGGWILYSQSIQGIFKRALQPLAVRHVASSLVAQTAVTAPSAVAAGAESGPAQTMAPN